MGPARRFPNLLVNGSQGIAVGMATNIPPHNLGEIIDAIIHLIDHPEATPDDLMAFVKGPDFPTGGLILGRAGIQDAYRTGRGSIKMRAICTIEDGPRGPEIIATEIPYQASVESIAEKAADLVNARTIEGIREIRNERANRVNRLVIRAQPRRGGPCRAQQPLQAHPPAARASASTWWPWSTGCPEPSTWPRCSPPTSATRSRLSPPHQVPPAQGH